MKCTWTEIGTLCQLWKDGHFSYGYNIISREMVTKTITKPVPMTTGWGCSENEFPEYLKGCEQFYSYNHISRYSADWELKPEYRENRPTYSVEISYELVEVEFTPEGEKEIKRRYNIHKRLMERYGRLMG